VTAARRVDQLKAPVIWSLVAVAVCWLYGPGELAFLGDNGGQFFVAERVASGVAPHVSSISGKSALSFLISGAGIFIGRTIGVPDYWSARLVSILVLAASVGLCWVVTYRLLGDESDFGSADSRFAAHLAALSMLSFGGYTYLGAMGARPKIFLVFFMLLTLLMVLQRRPLWTGVAATLAFLCWQPALIVLAASILPLMLWRPRRTAVGLWALGVFLAVALYEAYFVYHGAWREQLFQSFIFTSKYMAPEHSSVVKQPARLLRLWRRGFPFNPAAACLALWMVAFWYVLLADLQSARAVIQRRPASTYVNLCVLGAVAFTLYDHQGYADLFILIPYLAIATGAMVIKTEERIGRIWLGARGHPNQDAVDGERPPRVSLPARPFRWAAVVTLVLIVGVGVKRGDRRHKIDDQLSLAAELAERSPELNGIYAVNCTHLLALMRRSNWNEYGHFFRGVRELMLDRTSGPDRPPWKGGVLPDLIVVSGRLPQEIGAVLRTDYVKVEKRRYRRQAVAVWRRQERSAPASSPQDSGAQLVSRGGIEPPTY
jgi:hypothetical protein